MSYKTTVELGKCKLWQTSFEYSTDKGVKECKYYMERFTYVAVYVEEDNLLYVNETLAISASYLLERYEILSMMFTGVQVVLNKEDYLCKLVKHLENCM